MSVGEDQERNGAFRPWEQLLNALEQEIPGWKGGQGAVDTNKKQGWLRSYVMADLEAEIPHEEVTNKRGQGGQVGIYLESSERRR